MRAKISLPAVWIVAVASVQAASPPATPEEALRTLEVTARSGDVEGFMGVLASPARRDLTELLAASEAADRAAAALMKTLDDAFGSIPGLVPPAPFDMKRHLVRLVQIELLGKEPQGEDRVVLKTRTTQDLCGRTVIAEQTMTAVREGDAWRLFLPYLSGDGHSLRETLNFLARRRNACEVVASEVKASRHPDRRAAMVTYARIVAGKESR